jgi:hypothetical protein
MRTPGGGALSRERSSCFCVSDRIWRIFEFELPIFFRFVMTLAHLFVVVCAMDYFCCFLTFFSAFWQVAELA